MILLAALAATVAAFQAPDPQSATFHAGTRLVEVEVVVRNNRGPVSNLTKGDFTILDQGKPQRIDIFHAGQTTPAGPAVPLPPGTVSNRFANAGEASAGYTAVLYDRLNTRIDFKDYERKALVKLIRGMAPHEHVAIYVLGMNLHVLQDFTDDPAKLLAAIQNIDSGRDLMPADAHDALFGFNTDEMGNVITGFKMPAGLKGEMATSVGESAANVAQVNAAINVTTTAQALSIIIRHLSGMRGRRNLVWMMEKLDTPLPFMGMLLQSNIALYPVLAHSLEFDPTRQFMGRAGDVRRALLPGAGNPFATLMPDVMDTQRKVRELAATTGGSGFGDAEDVGLAVKTAEEDSRSAYTLGYYPAEDVLDGKYHSVTVKLAGKKYARFEVRYRPGYVASKQILDAPQKTTLADLFRNPLDDTGLGISGRVEPDTAPGRYKVHLIVDLHDIRLTREGQHLKGMIEMAFAGPERAPVETFAIDLTDAQLAEALRNGLKLVAAGVTPSGDAIRVAMRDPATGLAGSLRFPVGH